MRNTPVLLFALLGCGGSSTPKPVTNASVSAPPVIIALADTDRVRIVAVTPAETKTLRDVPVPGYLTDMQWILPDPIVLLDAPRSDCLMPEEFYKTHEQYVAAQSACTADPATVGVIGRVTNHGFVPYPKLPDSTWAGLKQPDENGSLCQSGCWSLTIRNDAVYEGHCIAAFSADGMEICDDWMYARIDVPGPAMEKLPEWSVSTPVAPTHPPAPAPAPIEVKASPLVKVELLAQEEEARYGGKLTQLRCTEGANVTLYPADVKELDLGMGEKVTWLSSNPPRFLAFYGHDGMTPHNENVLFEGCDPHVVGDTVEGPDDILIVDGTLYQRGRLIGTVPGAKLVDFSPM
ncbi:MAG TPA: hypothetical protein VGM90_11520 [Kofleriaceae bacterium]